MAHDQYICINIYINQKRNILKKKKNSSKFWKIKQFGYATFCATVKIFVFSSILFDMIQNMIIIHPFINILKCRLSYDNYNLVPSKYTQHSYKKVN